LTFLEIGIRLWGFTSSQNWPVELQNLKKRRCHSDAVLEGGQVWSYKQLRLSFQQNLSFSFVGSADPLLTKVMEDMLRQAPQVQQEVHTYILC